MKTYTCTDFGGHWPVGSAAVVLADNAYEAHELLRAELAKQSLYLDPRAEFKEVSERGAVVLCNGDY